MSYTRLHRLNIWDIASNLYQMYSAYLINSEVEIFEDHWWRVSIKYDAVWLDMQKVEIQPSKARGSMGLSTNKIYAYLSKNV